jgi:two-component system chemotaxis response regulator CheB
MADKVRVLVVDDTALVRQVLSELLAADPHIEVVGTAVDAYAARDKIKALNPDVITLDIEMPKMDGLTFLENLMRLRPMPVVMCSTLTERGAEATFKALELGAVDFIAKPKADFADAIEQYAEEIRSKVKTAACARVRALVARPAFSVAERKDADSVLPRVAAPRVAGTGRIIAIGASTGGTEAVREVLAALPAGMPPIVITQHIPELFSKPFAERLDRSCALTVHEAADGMPIEAGHAYVAPGGRHLLVVREGARTVCRLSDADPVNRHRPSVDVLFRSVANLAGANAIGVILTGMGDDGARGLLELLEAGAPTLAQDEATSVVWGMPGSAVKLGAAAQVLPLGRIAQTLLRLATEAPRGRSPRTATG